MKHQKWSFFGWKNEYILCHIVFVLLFRLGRWFLWKKGLSCFVIEWNIYVKSKKEKHTLYNLSFPKKNKHVPDWYEKHEKQHEFEDIWIHSTIISWNRLLFQFKQLTTTKINWNYTQLVFSVNFTIIWNDIKWNIFN